MSQITPCNVVLQEAVLREVVLQEVLPREIFPMIILNAEKSDFAVVYRLALTSSWLATWIRANADKIADYFATKYTTNTAASCQDDMTLIQQAGFQLPNGSQHGESLTERQKTASLTVICNENFRLGKLHGRSSYKTNFREDVFFWQNGVRTNTKITRRGLGTRTQSITVNKTRNRNVYITACTICEQYSNVSVTSVHGMFKHTVDFLYPLENLPAYSSDEGWLKWFDDNLDEIMRQTPGK